MEHAIGLMALATGILATVITRAAIDGQVSRWFVMRQAAQAAGIAELRDRWRVEDQRLFGDDAALPEFSQDGRIDYGQLPNGVACEGCERVNKAPRCVDHELEELVSSIGDEISKFTCDGCDSVYRRNFPGHCTSGPLEFCSEACKRNPLPFDAPPVTVYGSQLDTMVAKLVKRDRDRSVN